MDSTLEASQIKIKSSRRKAQKMEAIMLKTTLTNTEQGAWFSRNKSTLN
jgi:hypothetical protein